MSESSVYLGVNQETLRAALFHLYFGIGEPNEINEEGKEVKYLLTGKLAEIDPRMGYIIPLQGNWEDPIKTDSNNTYIQYWIEWDDRISMDENNYVGNGVMKWCSILLRFVGSNAENWAKMFHHLSSKNETFEIFKGCCNAELKEYVGRIVPVKLNFSGKNSSIAYDVRFRLVYLEQLEVPWKELTGVSLGQGEVIV